MKRYLIKVGNRYLKFFGFREVILIQNADIATPFFTKEEAYKEAEKRFEDFEIIEKAQD